MAEVDAATPGMDLDDEPPLDEDYIEPDMDSAYSYLDELASEHTAEPVPQAEPEPAAAPANGLALQWLELFRNLPISGMTGSIAANCTLIAVDGEHWLMHPTSGPAAPCSSATPATSPQRCIEPVP